MTLLDALLVGGGGAAGAVARHLVGLRVSGRRAITLVNVLGSLLLGVVLGLPIDGNALLFAGIGFCGAFTTFSSFAVEAVTTTEHGARDVAVRFGLLNLAGAIGAVLAGMALGGLV